MAKKKTVPSKKSPSKKQVQDVQQISGIILDCKSKKPIKYAQISLRSNKTAANSKGEFIIENPANAKRFKVEAEGYAPKNLNIYNSSYYNARRKCFIICLDAARKGVSEETTYLPELVIVLTDKEFAAIKGNANVLDDLIKAAMIQKAKKMFEGKAVEIPQDSEVVLCECNKHVGVIQKVNINGTLEGDPLPRAGSKEEGEADLNLYTRFDNIGFGTLSSRCCSHGTDPDNVKVPGNAINVGILDSAIDTDFVYNYFRTNHSEVDTSKFIIINRSCTTDQSSTDVDHGTTVAICLLKRLYVELKFQKSICINAYNIVRSQLLHGDLYPTNIITQADIVCALLKAIPENSYLNLSFGFNEDTHLIQNIMRRLPSSLKFVTTSAGNEGKDITNGINFHYPSGYARDFRTGKIREVTGTMKKGARTVRWVKDANRQTNNVIVVPPGYIKAEDDAVVNTNSKAGGTSFSSPRYLAGLIKRHR